jgi:hypothetical protein
MKTQNKTKRTAHIFGNTLYALSDGGRLDGHRSVVWFLEGELKKLNRLKSRWINKGKLPRVEV